MNKTRQNVGLIIFPSVRSVAYLSVFNDLGIYPAEIIFINKSIAKLDELREESQKYNYKNFFDVDIDVRTYIENAPSRVLTVNDANINSPEIIAALKECSCSDFIFSGGGILKKEILGIGKRFIHLHPGIVPDFRGSTCFYYSLLYDNSLGSTAFFMNAQIDEGDVILQTRFKVNYFIHSDQLLFMDYILDPYIRAQTLKNVLKVISDGKLCITKTFEYNTPAYYVMHPLLRHLTIHKINRQFDKDSPQGVFVI